jgi:hypothetical protein
VKVSVKSNENPLGFSWHKRVAWEWKTLIDKKQQPLQSTTKKKPALFTRDYLWNPTYFTSPKASMIRFSSEESFLGTVSVTETKWSPRP